MPKRKRTVRHDSTEVQGADSWVDIRKTSWQQQKDLRLTGLRLSNATEQDAEIAAKTNFDLTEQLITDFVANWNWVDDLGEPLTVPRADPTVISNLTSDEVDFLTTAILSSDKDTRRKN